MRVIVGDETGLLKAISLERNEQQIVGGAPHAVETQSRLRGIQRMSWYADERQASTPHSNQVVIARANAVIETFDTRNVSEPADASLGLTIKTKTPGDCIGLDVLRQFGSIVHGSSNGTITVQNALRPEHPSVFSTESATLSRMRVDPLQQTHVATGGNEHDLHVWALETQQNVFKAKNVPHDKLDMRVPVWIRDFQFLSSSAGSSNGFRIVAGTAYRHVRIYDTQTQRRPVQHVEFGEYPINALCVSPDETEMYVADTTGALDILDLRTLQHRGRCAGPDGAIRDIACHPTMPYIAAVGLDRMVHVFNTTTRACEHRVYAKQRMNAVLFCADEKEAAPVEQRVATRRRREANSNDEEDEDEDEEIEDVLAQEEVDYEGLEISDSDELDDADMGSEGGGDEEEDDDDDEAM